MVRKIIYGLLIIPSILISCNNSDQRINVSESQVQQSSHDSTATSTGATMLSKENDEILSKGGIVHLNETEFIARIFDFKHNKEWSFAGTKPAIVDFYADWCGPCKKMSPILEKMAKKYAGKIQVFKVNVDEQQTIAGVFGIQSIPSVMYCPIGKKPLASMGYIEEEEVEKYISQILN